MTERPEEVRALERESARAVRHFIVFWLGLPVLFFMVSATIIGFLSRVEDGSLVGVAVVAAVGFAFCFFLGRFLWRVIKK